MNLPKASDLQIYRAFLIALQSYPKIFYRKLSALKPP